MAEHLAKRHHSLSEIEADKLLCCAVCLDIYNDPIGVDCGHSFCRQCVKQLITKKCPVCKYKITKAWNQYASNWSLLNTIQFITGCDVRNNIIQNVEFKFVKKCTQLLHTYWIRSIAISPNSKYIASCGYSKYILIWDIESNNNIKSIVTRNDNVYSVAFNPDSTNIVCGSDSGIQILDINSGVLIKELVGHGCRVNSVSFSLDGRYILSGSDDRTFRKWDIETNQQHVMNADNQVLAAYFIPNSNHIVYSFLGFNIKIRDIESDQDIQTLSHHNCYHKTLVISPDGKYIAYGIRKKGVYIWDVTTHQRVNVLEACNDEIMSIAFSPDSTHIILGCVDGKLRIWDLALNRRTQTLSGHDSSANTVAVSPDKKYIVSSSWDYTLLVWKLKQ